MIRLYPSDVECDHQGGDKYFCATCAPPDLITRRVISARRVSPSMNPPTGSPDEVFFAVVNAFGFRSWAPYVEVHLGGLTHAHMDPDTARQAALTMLAAAETADQEGWIVSFFQNIGSDKPEAEQRGLIAAALVEFRKHRETRCPSCTHTTHGHEACVTKLGDGSFCKCERRISA